MHPTYVAAAVTLLGAFSGKAHALPLPSLALHLLRGHQEHDDFGAPIHQSLVSKDIYDDEIDHDAAHYEHSHDLRFIVDQPNEHERGHNVGSGDHILLSDLPIGDDHHPTFAQTKSHSSRGFDPTLDFVDHAHAERQHRHDHDRNAVFSAHNDAHHVDPNGMYKIGYEYGAYHRDGDWHDLEGHFNHHLDREALWHHNPYMDEDPHAFHLEHRDEAHDHHDIHGIDPADYIGSDWYTQDDSPRGDEHLQPLTRSGHSVGRDGHVERDEHFAHGLHYEHNGHYVHDGHNDHDGHHADAHFDYRYGGKHVGVHGTEHEPYLEHHDDDQQSYFDAINHLGEYDDLHRHQHIEAAAHAHEHAREQENEHWYDHRNTAAYGAKHFFDGVNHLGEYEDLHEHQVWSGHDDHDHNHAHAHPYGRYVDHNDAHLYSHRDAHAEYAHLYDGHHHDASEFREIEELGKHFVAQHDVLPTDHHEDVPAATHPSFKTEKKPSPATPSPTKDEAPSVKHEELSNIGLASALMGGMPNVLRAGDLASAGKR